MPATTIARRRRRRRKTKSALPLLLIVLLSLALAAVAIYYVGIYPRQIEQISYPLEYTDLIQTYGAEYGLDPARVAAVIYCESSFRPEAVSSAGAIGLMQIMPETGEWIAEKLDEAAAFTESSLYDPKTNIRYGCWYLNYLNGRFDGDLTKVTAAYHAGGGRVNEWLRDPGNSSDGKTLENIPSEVTGAYVKNVARAYEKYKEIMKA